MRLTGDARRRVVLAEIEESWRERQLEKELNWLREEHHRLRYLKDRHERQVRLPWVLDRLPAVARDLSAARVRARSLRDELAE